MTSIVDWKDRQEGDGYWRVFLVARTDEASDLVGSVFINPRANESDIEQAITDFFEFRKNDSDDGRKITNDFETLKSTLASYSADEFYQVDFKLTESGIARFKVIKSGDGQQKQLDDYVLCRQSFYYLKFSLHKHKHHPNNVDSLTTIHQLAETNVARSLIFDLKQSLVDIKRSQEINSINPEFNFNGITSYMRSLLQACLKESLMDSLDYEAELKLIDNTERSYKALIDKKTQRHSLGFNSRSEGRQFLILLFAILAPWAIFSIRDPSATPAFLSQFLHDVYTDDYKTGFFISTIFILYWARYAITFRFSSYSDLTEFIYRQIKSIVHEPRKAKILAITTLIIGAILIMWPIYSVLVT